MFGKFRQLVGRYCYCSYLLPYCPGKVAELSQREVVTNEMGHPVRNVDCVLSRVDPLDRSIRRLAATGDRRVSQTSSRTRQNMAGAAAAAAAGSARSASGGSGGTSSSVLMVSYLG